MSDQSSTDSTNFPISSSINNKAVSRFNEIKNRMKLNIFDQVLIDSNYPQKEVDRKRIQELLDHPEQNDRFSVSDPIVNKVIEHNREFVDEMFNRINNLGLPDMLSRAVALIISGVSANSTFELLEAVSLIEEYVANENKNKQNDSQRS